MTDTTTTPAPDTAPSESEPLGADFEALSHEAAALEGAGQAAADKAAEARATTEAASIADDLLGALQMVRTMAAPLVTWWPDYQATWSDATLRATAEAGAVIMQRHGWTMGQAWDKLGPYIALIAAVVPPSLVTWQAVQARRAALAAAARRPAPLPPNMATADVWHGPFAPGVAPVAPPPAPPGAAS